MSERDAFIRGIAANLYDDTARLAFADWLDDRGEHDRAAFIRVQVELEPMRDKYEIPRAAELHKREDELRKEAEWLGDMPAGWNDYTVGASVEFRRGFPDLLRCSAKAFLEFGGPIRARHPTIRRVVLHCLNGWGERLAGCDALKGVAELELACWYADADMEALGASAHLSSLQVLELWMGRREGGPDANLVRQAARGKAWPNLRELVLLDPDGNGEKGIKRLVASANRSAKRTLARYERGQDERLTLAPIMGNHYSGRLPDGRLAFVYDYEPDPPPVRAMLFTPDGEPIEEIAVSEPPGDSAPGSYDQRLQRHLNEVLGFEPAVIRVRPFCFEWAVPAVSFASIDKHIGRPETLEDGSRYDVNGHGGRAYEVIRHGEFFINNGNHDYYDKSSLAHLL